MLNLLRKILLITLVFLFPICTFSLGNENLLIQKNGVIIPIQNAIIDLKGSMEPIRNTSNYSVNIFNQKYVVNFKSGMNVDRIIFAISPANKKVNIWFVSVQPRKEIYFDDNFLDVVTDNSGNAAIKDFYPEPGDHWLELREGAQIVAKEKLSIKAKSDFRCSGKKMKCLIINV
jgi:hypothetical protein